MMELLTIEETLPYFKVSTQTFFTWIRRNKLPKGLVVKIGATVRIRKNVLEKYLNGEIG
jgi:excisionase family DNA binding protein